MSAPLTFGSLFAGIGGLDLGLERAGMRCVWQVEIDPYCRAVLAKHWPDVTRYEDVRDVGGRNLAPVDVICGGFPCQDVSVAGKRAGIRGERSGLWTEYARIIRELRPRFVVVENVPGPADRSRSQSVGAGGRIMTPRRLSDEVPQDREHGQRWHEAGLCVTCGGVKERDDYHHCESCYFAIFPRIQDYDDD